MITKKKPLTLNLTSLGEELPKTLRLGIGEITKNLYRQDHQDFFHHQDFCYLAPQFLFSYAIIFDLWPRLN